MIIMEAIISALVLILMMQICRSANQQRFIETFYLAENRALLNHVFYKKTSSPVICGRDCSMDPQCASFNYQIFNKCVNSTISPDQTALMTSSNRKEVYTTMKR